ncbi:MAG: PAS domain-containing protein [Alphaproteobacteria bacterium]|nr:PAS domain-containing protein [Alphaproteobacteria bacterium]
MIERRLSLRLLAYWERARAGRLMPQMADIQPELLEDVWADCFILQINDPQALTFSILHRGENLHDDWPQMAHLNGSISTLFSKRGPVLEDGQIFDADGSVVKYRQCLLPLGDGAQVVAVFGGARFKVFD